MEYVRESSFDTSPAWKIYEKKEKEDVIDLDPLGLAAVDVQDYESARLVADYHCNCKYLWLRELHGLSAFMMSNSLKEKVFWICVIVACASYSIYNTKLILEEYSSEQSATLITVLPTKRLKFPTLVFCPKNPDALHYFEILQDMYNNLGYMENGTNFDVIRYAIASFGFSNVDMAKFNDTYTDALNGLYLAWRGQRTQYEMFDFVFNKNGYNCTDMFQTCYGGSETLDCCDIFEPTYAMLRGRCYKLIDTYYQNDTDEVAKLSVFFNYMESPLLSDGVRSQIVMYNSDSHAEVGIFPRFYLNLHDWNRLRFTQKSMILQPVNGRCSEEQIYQGKFTCYVYKFVEQMRDMFNCTLPYYKGMLSYVADTPVCEPEVVVAAYDNVTVIPVTQGYKCTPACKRIENEIQLTTSIDYSPSPSYGFRIEASFTYLEFEQYEEVTRTTLAGFISELGGQSGLFVGCSIITFVQLLTSLFTELYQKCRGYYDRHYYTVRIGLHTTHATEAADKFYPRHVVAVVDDVDDVDELSTIREESERCSSQVAAAHTPNSDASARRKHAEEGQLQIGTQQLLTEGFTSSNSSTTPLQTPSSACTLPAFAESPSNEPSPAQLVPGSNPTLTSSSIEYFVYPSPPQNFSSAVKSPTSAQPASNSAWLEELRLETRSSLDGLEATESDETSSKSLGQQCKGPSGASPTSERSPTSASEGPKQADDAVDGSEAPSPSSSSSATSSSGSYDLNQGRRDASNPPKGQIQDLPNPEVPIRTSPDTQFPYDKIRPRPKRYRLHRPTFDE